ncbi:MAG: translational GTPase TypA [Succinivibrio sp.]|jgi:GTP-binding protein|nr:translational GTPase TypA [Succinivibrio sp.]
MDVSKIRNIAIIAHVDHGKTTLVDSLLRQSGTLDRNEIGQTRVMDSNAIEKERGITILSKNTAIDWHGYRINIVDTPGHADFGGEVERVMSMVDSVLLLVDAVDGPMPQTRFVTQKAFAAGLKPIVVINKCDREGARPSWVIDQVFDLFDNLGATDEQLDFPVVYASAFQGWSSLEEGVQGENMEPLFQTIVDKVSPPQADLNGPFQMQISSLDFTSYVGVIGVGRVKRGQARANQTVTIVGRDGSRRQGKIGQVMDYLGLHRKVAEVAEAGDIVAVTGLGELKISDTVCDPEAPEALPPLTVDEPTVTMNFCVNTSPFAGREGKFITSRNIEERLKQELVHNVALRVEPTEDADRFKVSGRGELHLSVLIEEMRREGYELAVSRPEVILKKENGKTLEPYELLTCDLNEENQGPVMEELGRRKGELKNMSPDGKGRVRIDYRIPSRGLIGFQTLYMTLTSGTGLMYHSFDSYDEFVGGTLGSRANGVIISNSTGKTVPYALWFLQERGRLFVGPGEEIYEGQIIGQHVRDNDLTVNALKTKKLTNVRAAGSDDNIILTPPVKMSLEQCLEYINEDELVEVTPVSLRLRKKNLSEMDRIRAFRAAGGKKAAE